MGRNLFTTADLKKMGIDIPDPHKSDPPQLKYRNKIVRDAEGNVYRSIAERDRWWALQQLQKAGHIFHLDREVQIPLHAFGGHRVGHYRADAVYSEDPEAAASYIRSQDPDVDEMIFLKGCVVEDTKGGDQTTDLFDWKARHFKAQYGFDIRIYKK